MLDARQFTMYGSDISEVVHMPVELKRFMDDDFRLLHTAKIGPVGNLDVRVGPAYASAFFDTPFSAAGAPPVRVRFATV